MFLQSAKSRTMFYFEYIGSVSLLLPYQRPECCFKSKIFSCLDRDMTIFRDFHGPRPRRDIGMARPRHSKTCLETETRLEISRLWVDHAKPDTNIMTACSLKNRLFTGKCLQFWYHSYGDDIGELKVFKKNVDDRRTLLGSPLWIEAENEEDRWVLAKVDIYDSQSYQVSKFFCY